MPMIDNVKASVFLPRDLHLAATMIAKEQQTSLSQFIEALVAKAVEKSAAKKGKAA